MKYRLLTIAAFALCLLPMTAVAGSKQSAKINFSDPVVISGTHIAPGDYTIRWDGTGSDVKVEILKDNKQVVSAPAKVVDQRHDYVPTILTRASSDGSSTVTEIGLAKVSLQFSE